MLVKKLKLNAVSEKLWQHISVDFITKLSVLRSFNSILVVCNRFMKISHLIVTIEKIIVEELTKLFRNNI